MKLKWKKLAAVALGALTAVSAFAGCGGGGNLRDSLNNESQAPQDNTKTQLYVGFYYSGLGKEWIQQAAAKFEAANTETVFEEGKKGVQVRLDLDKAGLNGGSLMNTISSSRDQIFFIENGDMYQFIEKDYIKDITHLVKAPAAEGESQTIEDKLTVGSKGYYNVNDKYYAMPYYEGIMGINFNMDLFKAKNYYFAEGKCADGFDFENDDLSSLFVSSEADAKSWGVDNIKGTYDDGLPATYDDFKALLMRISIDGNIPMVWCGTYLTYLIEFMNAVWADYEGYDQMMLNWSMNGTATDLINVTEDGTITQLDPVTITDGDKGDMLQKQAGKYYALKFAEMCVEDSNYYYSDSFSSSLSHLNAQKYFVKGAPGGNQEIAMLIDGNWWDVEATSQFDSDPTSANSKLNKNFGFMPLPKVNKAAVESTDNTRTLITLNNSMTFINANTTEEMMPVTEAFFKYVHSDEALNIFSQYTNMMRPMNYTVTDATLAQMSPYGREMNRIHEEARKTQEGTAQYKVYIQDTYPTTTKAIANTNLLNPKTWGWSEYTGKDNPFVVFKDTDASHAIGTAEKYFNSLHKLYVGSWGTKWN